MLKNIPNSSTIHILLSQKIINAWALGGQLRVSWQVVGDVTGKKEGRLVIRNEFGVIWIGKPFGSVLS